MDEQIVSDARRVMLAKVRQARKMSGEARVLAGPRLFAAVCERMKEGLRDDYPELDDEGIHQKLVRRLRMLRRLDLKRQTAR
jgi:hypothetical protein